MDCVPIMRNFFRSHWKVIVAIILLVVLALFTVNPGAATASPPLAARLRAHVAAIAPGGDDGATPPQLQQAARYIEATLRADGYAIRRQADGAGGQAVRKLQVSLANLAPHAQPARIFIVGAHVGAPADAARLDADRLDPVRGSGAAAVLELARLLKDLRPSRGTEIRFVFFFTGAPTWPGGQGMGRNFIAYVGTLDSSRRVQQALAAFQGSVGAPPHGLAAPAYVQGMTLFGHAAARRTGDPAIMVTDTAFGRYPYFEATNEPAGDAPAQPAQPDFSGIARVVIGLAHTIEALAAGQQG
jgi:hypothetical protein